MSDHIKKYKSTTWLMIRPWLAGLLVFLLVASASFYIISQRYHLLKSEEKRAAENVAESVADRLQQSLQYSLSATQALSFIIDKEGIPRNFDSVAALILKNNKYIDALEMVPGGVVKYIYPAKENEAAIDYNILEDNSRNKEALKAIEKGELFFAGPLELKQGGMGVVGRLPVFKNDKFWGFTAVIIRLPTLLRAAGIDTSGESGYYFQLSKINPNTGKEEFFLPLQKFSSNEYEVSVSVPDGEWKLSLIPVNGYKTSTAIVPICLLALMLSVIAGVFAVYAGRIPSRLQRLVLERTTELERIVTETKKAEQRIKDSEAKYRTLVEQASDGIFIVDFKGNFIVVNPAACRLSQYSEEELMTMRVYDLAIASELQVTPPRFKEIATGKTVTSERKMKKKNGELIDVEVSARMISEDRFLAFVRDISERKKAELELIKSREDMRRLSNHIENIREEERLNMSREIHDELGQQLTVLKMNVSRLGKKIPSREDPLTIEINEILTSINQMVETVRKISAELRPGLLDDIGLTATLDWYSHDFSKKTGIKTKFTSTVIDDKFPKKLNINLFRIFQESLTNVARHSEADKAEVSLRWQDQQLVLLIEDNGKGFESSISENTRTLGIMGMQERAAIVGGTYKVYSQPGKGTIIEVVVPFHAPELVESQDFL